MEEVLDFVHEFVPGSSKRTCSFCTAPAENEHDLIQLGPEIETTPLFSGRVAKFSKKAGAISSDQNLPEGF